MPQNKVSAALAPYKEGKENGNFVESGIHEICQIEK